MRRIVSTVLLLSLALLRLQAAQPKPTALKFAYDPYVYPSGTNILKNSGFESQSANWITTGNCDFTQLAAPNSGYALRFNAGNTTPNAVASQGFATVVGLTYTVSFKYGVYDYNTGTSQAVLATVKTPTGAVLASQQFSATGSQSITFSTKTFTFTASSTSAVLAFTDVSPATASIDSYIDSVVVDPTSMAGVCTVYKCTWLGTVASPWKKAAIVPWTRNSVTLTLLPGTYHYQATASVPVPLGSTNWMESLPSNIITNTVK